MKLSKYYRRLLISNVAVWVAYISINFSAFWVDSSRAGREVDYSNYVVAYLISFGPWMLATPVFYYFLHKAQQQKRNLFATSLLLMAGWFPCIFWLESISIAVMRPEEKRTLFEIGLNMPAWYWVYYGMLFSAAVGVCISLIFYRRSSLNRLEAQKMKEANMELELQLSELRMKSLQTQLEPHFLFNALNSISSLVRISEKKLALDAIKQVSDLLRYAVDASNHLFVRFDDELAFVKDYLALQKLRFEEKLEVELIDNRTSYNQECPPFILQIFVENAIRHGLERAGETMQLSVKISNHDTKLSLFIQNTHQRSKKNGDTLGIGLKNLRDRIEILYQDPIEFEQFETAQHYTVEITIPEVSNI